MGMVEVKRFQVYLVALDPVKGAEIQKNRPCVIVSPNELNSQFRTVIIAPMTTHGFISTFRIPTTFNGKKCLILLDHVLSVDKRRLLKKLGTLSESCAHELCGELQEMFAY